MDLEWAKFTASLVTPLVAVMGGLVLFYAQKRRERLDILRTDRQQTYLRYIQSMRNESAGAPWDEYLIGCSKVFRQCRALHEELCIVAPDDVVKCSARFLGANATASMLVARLDDQRQPQESAQKTYEKTQELSEAASQLIMAMRKDVLRGTQIAQSDTYRELHK